MGLFRKQAVFLKRENVSRVPGSASPGPCRRLRSAALGQALALEASNSLPTPAPGPEWRRAPPPR